MADAKGVRAGGAYVEIFSNDAALQKGLKAAKAKVEEFGAAVLKIGAGLSALGATITAPLVAATAQFAESGAALKEMSERTGISVESLSLLKYAAQQSGAELGSVEVGIRKMQKALVAGSLENQQAQLTFMRLGLSVQQLMRLKPEQQFEVIGKRIAMIKDESARAGAAMMIFGRSGTELIPMLMNMEKLSREAHEFGLVMSTETAEDAKRLKDSMGLLEAVISKIWGKIGSALAPAFEAWNLQMAKIAKQILDLIEANKPLIPMIFQVGLAITGAGIAVVALGTAIVGTAAVIGGISTIVSALGVGLGLLLSPLGLIALGFVGMTTAMGKWGEAGKNVMAFLNGQFGTFLVTAQQTFKGVADAIKAGDIQLAVKILWAGLKVEWIKGVQYVSGIWASIKNTAIEAFEGMKTEIAGTLIELWANIQKGVTNTADFFRTTFASIMDNITVGWNVVWNKALDILDQFITDAQHALVDFVTGVKTEWAVAKGVMTGGLAGGPGEIVEINKQAEKQHAEADAALKERQTARSKSVDDAKAEREKNAADIKREHERKIAEIEAARAGSQEALLGAASQAKSERQKAQEGRAAAAAKELADAQKELSNLTTNAAVLALGGEKEKARIPGGGGEAQEPLTPESLDKGMEKAKEKIDIAGSFQAAALPGLGAGKSTADEQLSEQKKTNDHLSKLNHKVDTGKLAFA